MFRRQPKVPIREPVIPPPAPVLPEEKPLKATPVFQGSEEKQQEAALSGTKELLDNAAEEGKDTMRESDMTSSISRSMVIDGNITSDDNIEIFGTVNGDISTQAILKIHGSVCGNIICGTLVAGGGTIKGNIKCEESVVIHEKTQVEGDIVSKSASISGTVDGNVTAAEEISITQTGVVHGNVDSAVLEVMKGAVLVARDVQVRKAVPPEEKEKTGAPKNQDNQQQAQASPVKREPLQPEQKDLLEKVDAVVDLPKPTEAVPVVSDDGTKKDKD